MSGTTTTNTSLAKRERRVAIDRAAGYLALGGATLGIIVGLVDVAVGASIRDWVGNKLHTTTLGIATVILTTVSLAAAVAWRRPGGRAGGRRLATVLAFLITAGVCFTTVGRLWYLPGILLLTAGVLVLVASSPAELIHAVDEHRWLNGLVAVLGPTTSSWARTLCPKPSAGSASSGAWRPGRRWSPPAARTAPPSACSRPERCHSRS